LGAAKAIILRPIKAAEANAVVRRVHYSGKVVNNSQFHIGVFHHGKLEGAMQFGPSLDKRKLQGVVEGTPWNGFIELNRMAFSEALPRNSESRALGIALKMLRKHAPHLQWVVSFADATQCGDGTIYRAAGFALTGITVNKTLYEFPTGHRVAGMTIEANWDLPVMREICDSLNIEHKQRTRKTWERFGAKPILGYQLRYLYFLDPTARHRLTVPILPFSEIERRGAGMYRGKLRAVEGVEVDPA
jgi:hypothetical protein